ncbi:MAG: hypothetical protein HC794_08060 [Nitrospiraceae bacterium]|nr:hypothetical protein [Nitrospiraceae bacterium]
MKGGRISAFGGWSTPYRGRFLDPQLPTIPPRKLVRETLYNQIFGMDINAGAVHIAAVSLYLAALELDPNPRRGHGVKFEPLVSPKNSSQRSRRPFFNLHAADAFDLEAAYNGEAPFAQKALAVVVGNPPWTRPRGERAARGRASDEELRHVVYCRNRNIPLPHQDPPDQAFLWRAADFSREGGRFGFFLSARRFFSHHLKSRTALESLLQRFAPVLAVNLASLHREGIFPSALHPAMLGYAPITVQIRKPRSFSAHRSGEKRSNATVLS